MSEPILALSQLDTLARAAIDAEEAVQRYSLTPQRDFLSETASALFLVAHNAREALADAMEAPVVLSLLSRLRAGEEDTKRLDWLHNSCAEVRRPDADTLYVRLPICVRQSLDGDCTRSKWGEPTYGDIRGAIDKAAAAVQEGA